MKTKIHYRYIVQSIAVAVLCLQMSCKKQDDFLNALPDISLTVPKSLDDLQLMLQGVNYQTDNSLGMVYGEEYFIMDSYFATMDQTSKNMYTFAKDLYPNRELIAWNTSYSEIFQANNVLEKVDKFGQNDPSKAANIKATALFFRAWAFYNLVQTFAMPYDPKTAETDPGIPLRLEADINIKSKRGSVQSCYSQILKDVIQALPDLPNATAYISLPNKVAGNAFLARVYLAMNDYGNALKYADAGLSLSNTLTDYNTLNQTTKPISKTNLVEEIFRAASANDGDLPSLTKCFVNPDFYALYDSNDLRRNVFFYPFSSNVIFYGSYDVQHSSKFTGLATDEVYLIRAECLARQGKTAAAMDDLNTLLVKRWKTGTYVIHTAIDAQDALKQILLERRKELVFRGLRWTDLRRLNKDPQFAVTLKHIVNGVTYTLPPNDKRYALPIPDSEIQLSGIQQNQY